MSLKNSRKDSSTPVRHISPEEQAWLEEHNRQLEYDEYMQAQRELWLWERPSRKKYEYDRLYSQDAGAEGGTV